MTTGTLSSVHFVSCTQRTSGLTSSSQRVRLGMRARMELTFHVAISILNRQQKTGDQRAAANDVVHFDMLVNRMRAVAANTEPVEHGNPECSEKVSVRRAADLRFAELESEMRRNTTRLFKQFDNSSGTFQ